VEIYIAVYSGVIGTLLLGVAYAADRYEREPIELLQNSFIAGLAVQLVLLLAVALVSGHVLWSGGWLIVTVVGVAALLPLVFERQVELDERFDGIVYSVAVSGGAVVAIHLNNLPGLLATSPFSAALATGAEPDLRDLLIVVGSGAFAAELDRGLLVMTIAVLVGAIFGVLHMRRTSPWRSSALCGFTALVIAAADLVLGEPWQLRFALAAVAVIVGLAIKRRSVFRARPQPTEGDVLIAGLKTILMVFGAALLATVLLQAVVDQPTPLDAPGRDLDRSTRSSAPRTR
jgi:hypothetical protein